MGFALAIKRSYRFFVPSLTHIGRQTVREYYLPVFGYLLGFSSAVVQFVPWPQRESAMHGLDVAMLVLLLLGLWAKNHAPKSRVEA